MRSIRGRDHSRGYTVVEVFIFLAVAGGMFVSAATIFTRYQRDTQFNQSVKQLESEFNDIINDTATGVFPELNDIACEHTAGSGLRFVAQSGSESGSNNQCVFLGKAIQLGDEAYDADNPDSTYLVHTVIGKNEPLATSFSSGIMPGGSAADHTYFQAMFNDSGGSPMFDTTEAYDMQWGSGIKSAYIRRDGISDIVYIRGIAVLYDRFGEYSPGAGAFSGGSSSVGLYAVVSDQFNQTNINFSRQSPDDFRDGLDYSQYQAELTQYVPLRDTLDGAVVCIENDGEFAALELNASLTGGAPVFVANLNPPTECTV